MILSGCLDTWFCFLGSVRAWLTPTSVGLNKWPQYDHVKSHEHTHGVSGEKKCWKKKPQHHLNALNCLPNCALDKQIGINAQ